MSNISNKKVQDFIRNNHLFPEMEEWEDPNIPEDWAVSDFLYAEFYLIKKLSLKNGFDITKIKNSSTFEEYKQNITDEIEKLENIDLNFELKDFYWNRFYEDRELVFSFIDDLNIQDFDISVSGDAWFMDNYLREFINVEDLYNVLSIYMTYYDENISKMCNIETIYNEFQYGNITGHKARLDMIDNNNYTFRMESFPKILEKKYDLILFNLEYGSIDALDKTGLIKMVDGVGGVFDGDSVTHNIYSISDNLSSSGVAIIKTPFTFISKLNDEILDSNKIDKIIYLPKETEPFAYERSEVKNVYVIVKKNKDNDEIEFIDKSTGERCSVKNEIIMKHRGCTNMHIYTKHNPMLEKLYRIKDDNTKQLEIISKSTEMIDKQIDELDFE